MAEPPTPSSAPPGRDPHTAIPSPRTTLLPYISAATASQLAYPPNLLPGGRDVATPYGTMRVNEWGRADGRKVLLVHGDSNPSPFWSRLAHGLTGRGWRVMTLDLWGRGYSDAPTGVRFDARLYGTQLLCAVTSSRLFWTGGEGFAVVGYSLGGGIAVDFAGTFPGMVRGLCLLAPAGLLRGLPGKYDSPYIHDPGKAPSEGFLRGLVGEIVGVELENPDMLRVADGRPYDERTKPEEAPEAEADWEGWRPKEDLRLPDILQWQWDYHKGFVHAFSRTAKEGAIVDHFEMWRRLGGVLRGETKGRMTGKKVLVYFGEDDDIIMPEQTRADILRLVDERYVEFETFPGDHSFVQPQSDAIVERLSKLWDLQ